MHEIECETKKCLEDGQRMEDGLVKKQTTINSLCDEVEELQHQVDLYDADHYNRQISGID